MENNPSYKERLQAIYHQLEEYVSDIYRENKELKEQLSKALEQNDKYKTDIKKLDSLFVDLDKAFGKKERDYQGLVQNFRGLYEKVKLDLKTQVAEKSKLWKIINGKNSKIKSLKPLMNLESDLSEKKMCQLQKKGSCYKCWGWK